MAPDTILEVDKVSKIYSRSRAVTQQRLGMVLGRVLSGRGFDQRSTELRQGEFRAVNNVSFSLRRGEALGIIGLNGSGKTTLLRMLAGQILPDAGSITVTGRTASMIDLTAGFQTSASGRENIFLRGAALGRSRAQMEADYQSIVDFSELGDAISAPVSTYSSGMTMRLAFSIISASAPDLMFIDEVLAVGDFRFRQKCLARINELREQSAFVMVSHSMRDIMRFCDQTIVLQNGVPVFLGPSPEAVNFFETEIEEKQQPQANRTLSRVVGPTFENPDVMSEVEAYWCDAGGNTLKEIRQGDPVSFRTRFRCMKQPKNLIVGIPMWSQDGIFVSGFSTDKIYAIQIDRNGFVDLRMDIPNFYFNTGTYHSNFVVVDGSEFLWRTPNDTLTVLPRLDPHWGVVTIPYAWKQ